MRRTARADHNGAALVAFLRELGGTWTPLGPASGRDKGRPDGVWGFNGRTGLAEIKQPGEDPREDQLEWHSRWRGAPVDVWRTAKDVARSMSLTVTDDS